jgi:nitroimidazol reductase NimA-like FMN-containing flavoprotein (pyridoxamine 5'-phosphate oxidase superfamily)
MRRISRKVNYQEAREILYRASYGVLSTVCDDGMPYGVPLSYVLTGNSLYFHCATEGQKLDNIRHDSRVCFTVVAESGPSRDHLTMEYASAMAFGTAHIVYAEDERQAGFRLLAGKYAPELTEEALDTYIKSCAEEATVVRIEVEYIAGKANRGAAMG